jgi:orotate phosphoribosyltransferase
MLDLFAEDIATKIGAGMERPDWVLGAPLGGLLLAQRVAGFLDCRCLYAEKKVTAVATNGQRESAELIFGRHLPPKDTRGIGIEDVFNNFSTTGELFSLVEEHGATLIGMAGALNRSDRTSLKEGGKTIPVVSALQIPSAQFRQDDPAVADDIRRGNVVWKPKVEWERLMRAMTQQIASPHDVARLSPRPVSH